MINTENSTNCLTSGGSTKTALRDVQNENAGTIPKQKGCLSLGDSVKVCGTKHLTPERRPAPHCLLSLAHNNNNGANENVMNARRRFELELGRGRLHNNIERFSELKNAPQPRNVGSGNRSPANISGDLTAALSFLSNGPPFSISSGKQGNGGEVGVSKHVEAARATEPKMADEQLRAERFLRLQKFLKQCDDTHKIEYTQRILHLPPSELSKHAVELEKRAIQLTIEEGNEIRRMRALNILEKSSPRNNRLLKSQKH